MSAKHIPAYADPRGIIMCSFGGVGYGIIAEGSAVPADGGAGYEEGCLFWVRGGVAGATLYVNEGTVSSCAFKAMAARGSSRIVSAGGATLTVTQALHDGKIILLDQATGTAVTLPPFTGSGAIYQFKCTANTSGGSQVITATGAFLFGGLIQNTDTGASGLFGVSMATNAGGSTVITLDGSTKGGRKGDWFDIRDVATNTGMVSGSLNASGTEATCFS